MKICLISHAYPPEKLGGAEVYAERIAAALAHKGHRVTVITQAPFRGITSLLPKKYTKNGISFYSFYPLNIFSIYQAHKKPLLAKALWRAIDLINPLPALLVQGILKKERPDIIHTQIIHGFSPLFLFRAIKKIKIPLVQTIHSYGFLCFRCDLLRPSGRVCRRLPFFCRVFARISAAAIGGIPQAVISPSKFCLLLHAEQGFFSQAKKIVLANGVALSDTLKENHNTISRREFRIIFAGRLAKNKGAQVLIGAFRKLAAPQAKLIIAGEGNWENKLRRLCQGDKRIVFTGKLSAEEMRSLYASASLTVVPSLYYEPFGNCIIESLAAGVPVIASRIGGIPELIQEGSNGYLFEPGDRPGLKKLLERIILNPQQLEALSQNAFLSSRQYDLTKHIGELEKIYAEAKNVYA